MSVMIYYKNSTLSINHDIKTLADYSDLKDKGQDPLGRVYLRVLGDQLELTPDKTKQATQRQVNDYVKALQKNIDADQKLNGVTEEKTDLKNRLSETFSKYLNAVIEDYSDDFDETIVIPNTMPTPEDFILIPEDNPFYKTDLIVIKDDFIGVMPLNGIKNSEFIEISKRMMELKQQRKVGSLFIAAEYVEVPADREYFKNEIKDMIVTLCTRREGRDIVNALIGQKNNIFIFPENTAKASFIQIENILIIRINSDLYVRLPTYRGLSSGNKGRKDELEETPLFIILGHEMIHALHYVLEKRIMYEARITREIPQIDNLEEQKTILGWGKINYNPIPLNAWQKNEMTKIESSQVIADMDFNDWAHEMDALQPPEPYFEWEEKSENGLRAAFGIPPREADHQKGELNTKKKKAEYLKKDFFLEIEHREKLSEVKKSFTPLSLSESFTPLFVELMSQQFGWQTFLNEAIEKACETKYWDLAIDLQKKGAEISRIKWGHTLDRNLLCALISEDEKTIGHLLDSREMCHRINNADWKNTIAIQQSALPGAL